MNSLGISFFVVRRILFIFALAAGLTSGAAAVHAQITVALRLDETRKPSIAWPLLCNSDYSNCGMTPQEKSKASFRKEVGTVKVSRVGRNFNLLIDANQNGRLTDERKIFLRNGGSVRVRIRKQVAPNTFALRAFEITHSLESDGGVIRDTFEITPHYVASGRLRTDNCRAMVHVSDLNYDGSFTTSDSKGGTNLGIDRNNDGRFWGKGEFLKTSQLIEFCGQTYIVSSLTNRTLSLRPTALTLAKVNESVPPFSMTVLNGKTITSDTLKGKDYVLDFWASWCAPCVKNLPAVRLIEAKYESIAVFSINVDEISRREKVEAIIDEAKIRDMTVIRGLGDADPIWKTFGGTSDHPLTIPLYVLVDKRGVIRYAGYGGDDLTELNAQVEKLLRAR